MNDRLTDLLSHLFAFDITAHLLRHDFVQQAVVAGALLGLVAGLVGPFIVMRQMSFAVHGSSELSLTGAAFALLVGYQVGAGALVGSALAAALFEILGQRARERDWRSGWCWRSGWAWRCCSSTSIRAHRDQLRAADRADRGVGYGGGDVGGDQRRRGRRAGGLLSPTVVRHRRSGGRRCAWCAVTCAGHRVRGVGRRRGSRGGAIVGALLVVSLLITPAAAAARAFRSPAATIAAAVLLAEISAVGGIVLSLAPGVPVSVFVATISFLIYLACWLVGRRRQVPVRA